MTKYELTAKEIVEIYNAGRQSGRAEATDYEWGSQPTNSKYSELEDCLILGDGILTGAYFDFSSKETLWKLFLFEAGIK